MAALRIDGRRIELEAGETVLHALLRSKVDVPYYCQVGSCKTCVVRAVGRNPPPGTQLDLYPGQVERGCFLACICVPVEDLEVARDE